MISIQVTKDKIFSDYEEDANRLLSLLRNSNSKYKDTNIDDIRWGYSFSYFKVKPKNDEANNEYYEMLYSLPYEKRLNEEYKKVRINIIMSAGQFYISDRTSKPNDYIPDVIKEVVDVVTIKKMIIEQSLINNEEVMSSIPELPEYQDMNGDELNEIINQQELSLDEQLKKAISDEDYMEAARIRDLINSQDEDDKM